MNKQESMEKSWEEFSKKGDFSKFIQELKNQGVVEGIYQLNSGNVDIKYVDGSNGILKTDLPSTSEFNNKREPAEVKALLNELHFHQINLATFIEQIAISGVAHIDFEFEKMIVSFADNGDNKLLIEDIPTDLELKL